jgi:hypothetical protein
MSVQATVLFGRPQQEIASLLMGKLRLSTATSIVTGFATPGGLEAIAAPIKARPGSVAAIILGAATYPGFETLDELYAAGVPLSRLHVHLGHTRPGFKKHPTVRFHPMLHSKIYYMELPGGEACAFVGSHNMTSFALNGLNGEAGVLLEGATSSPEFQQIRDHIAEARRQSAPYAPAMKESLAWWTREYIDGLRSEVKLPIAWIVGRTILIFAQAGRASRPRVGDTLYFELPAGIQIDSLKTEAHLFLFDNPPTDPWVALAMVGTAFARYTCKTTGAENDRGNVEIKAEWQIDGVAPPVLSRVSNGIVRPHTPGGMQQVRAEVEANGVVPYEYNFEQEKKEWDPIYSEREGVVLSRSLDEGIEVASRFPVGRQSTKNTGDPDDRDANRGWKLVTGLKPRDRIPVERDAKSLALALPESGRLILVSLRRRKRDAVVET